MYLRFVMTCPYAPEQYDVFWGDGIVAYVRIRYGELTVDCPDIGGERVLELHMGGPDCLYDDEYAPVLAMVYTAISDWISREHITHEVITFT